MFDTVSPFFFYLNIEINKTRPKLIDPTKEIGSNKNRTCILFSIREIPLFESKCVAISLVTETNLPERVLKYLFKNQHVSPTNLHIFLFDKNNYYWMFISGDRKAKDCGHLRRFLWVVTLTKWTSVVGVVMTIRRLTKTLLRLVDILSVKCVLSSRYLQTYFSTSYI